MDRIAIIGLGLMGGSLGLALKQRNLASVTGYARRKENREEAIAAGAVDAASDQVDIVVQGSDIVVFCLPVLLIPEMARACRGSVADGAVITDVGSTKGSLVSEMEGVFDDVGAEFVGSHPIAGSDESGFGAARADLYEGAEVVVTSTTSNPDAVRRIQEMWAGLGSNVLVMSPDEHDRAIARTSHLPHLVAAMLVNRVHDGADEIVKRLCGPGFRDTTRIAGGSADMWHDIVKSNSRWVGEELAEFQRILADVERMIAKGDFESLRAFLKASRELRQEYEHEDGAAE